MTSDIDIHLLLQKNVMSWLIIKCIFIKIHYFNCVPMLGKDIPHSSYSRNKGESLKKWLRDKCQTKLPAVRYW